MITDVPTAAEPPPPASVLESTSFDERWAAWQAKGAAHDRAFRRKLAIGAPVLLFVVAVVMYALLGR